MSITHIDPLGDGISSLELVRVGGSDLDVVNAARVSYGKRSEELSPRDEKLINFLLEHEHTSPLEHTQLVYHVKCPIYIARQWMRHRIGVSYNEISGRYAEVPLEFYVPAAWRVQDPNNKQSSVVKTFDEATATAVQTSYSAAINTACEAYKKLLEAGVCRELARGVLPLCTYTSFVFTCNLVSLFHFVRLRAEHGAQWEIQTYARGLLDLARSHFPYSIHSWQRHHMPPEKQQSV